MTPEKLAAKSDVAELLFLMGSEKRLLILVHLVGGNCQLAISPSELD
ncbi:hypothetical protein [Mesorhizobium huakuii]